MILMQTKRQHECQIACGRTDFGAPGCSDYGAMCWRDTHVEQVVGLAEKVRKGRRVQA